MVKIFFVITLLLYTILDNDEQMKSFGHALFALANTIKSYLGNVEQIKRFSDAIGLSALISYVKSNSSNDEQIKRFSDALSALTSDIESEFQKLRSQISRLEDDVKSQNRSGRPCPAGFNYSVAGFPKCYAVLSDRVNWDTAQQICRQLHSKAQLAVIISSREAQITAEILRNHECIQHNDKYTGNEFWIGARRGSISDCSSTLQWTSSSGATFSMQYSNWAPGEPNCGTGRYRESCASIDKSKSYKWNDLTCTWNACPVCEVTMFT